MIGPGDSDRDLVARARAGDASALEQLFSRYKALVRSRAGSMHMPGSDPEDVVQEGMIGLFKAIRDFDLERSIPFSSFASDCVSAQITDAVRKATRKKHRPLNESLSLQEMADRGADRDPGQAETPELVRWDPEADAIARETADAIAEFLRTRLSPLERETVRLLLAGLAYREIADHLGRSAKAVDNALSRARRKIGRMLKSGA